MIEISLCMIVKNEELTLERCLKSVEGLFDEIIIVDTGSTDNTKQIAKNWTPNVFDFKWIDDFSAARNFSFSKATKDYIMWLDADDVMFENDKQKFLELKNTLSEDVDMVYMPYNIDFDESGNPTFSYYRERLVKKNKNPIWIEPIHEVISMEGKYIFSDIAINHKKIKANPKGRNLKIYYKMLKEKKPFSPRMQFYFARELMFNGKYKRAISAFNKFLDDPNGWHENKIQACIDLSTCYKSLNMPDLALKSLFKSFEYDLPKAEALCKIGEIYFESGKLIQASYWYELALIKKGDKNPFAFTQEDYHGFIPCIQLCVINYRLGKLDLAIQYNQLAGHFKPNNPSYLHNKQFFESLKSQS